MACEEHPRNLSTMYNAELQKGVEAFGELRNDDAQAPLPGFQSQSRDAGWAIPDTARLS